MRSWLCFTKLSLIGKGCRKWQCHYVWIPPSLFNIIKFLVYICSKYFQYFVNIFVILCISTHWTIENQKCNFYILYNEMTATKKCIVTTMCGDNNVLWQVTLIMSINVWLCSGGLMDLLINRSFKKNFSSCFFSQLCVWLKIQSQRWMFLSFFSITLLVRHKNVFQ